jgi:hypothetical protein
MLSACLLAMGCHHSTVQVRRYMVLAPPRCPPIKTTARVPQATRFATTRCPPDFMNSLHHIRNGMHGLGTQRWRPYIHARPPAADVAPAATRCSRLEGSPTSTRSPALCTPLPSPPHPIYPPCSPTPATCPASLLACYRPSGRNLFYATSTKDCHRHCALLPLTVCTEPRIQIVMHSPIITVDCCSAS